jgi:holo-[acyl-carrier protein] synthase
MTSVKAVGDTVATLTVSVASANVAAIGVDAVDTDEFSRDVAAAGSAFLDQCFVPDELAHCAGDIEKLASRFALKEATLKALGTGIRGIGLLDVIVETAPSGQPTLRLSESASAVAAEAHLSDFKCSATHESPLALAVVVASSY